MSTDNSPGQPLAAQPLLPRVKLIWSFAAITAAAVLISLVQWAGEGHALIVAIVSLSAWMGGLFACFSILFLITYALGILETLLAPPQHQVLSPFAGDRLPEQVIAPLHVDDK